MREGQRYVIQKSQVGLCSGRVTKGEEEVEKAEKVRYDVTPLRNTWTALISMILVAFLMYSAGFFVFLSQFSRNGRIRSSSCHRFHFDDDRTSWSPLHGPLNGNYNVLRDGFHQARVQRENQGPIQFGTRRFHVQSKNTSPLLGTLCRWLHGNFTVLIITKNWPYQGASPPDRFAVNPLQRALRVLR